MVGQESNQAELRNLLSSKHYLVRVRVQPPHYTELHFRF